MSNPLADIRSYSEFVYSLPQRNPAVIHSSLTLAPIGATLAKLEGHVDLREGLRVEVWELVDFASQRIRSYSYEVYRHTEKIGWYDAWEHPEIPAPAATFPHHRHILPNLRDNRVPAPAISFTTPNLDVVVEQVLT